LPITRVATRRERNGNFSEIHQFTIGIVYRRLERVRNDRARERNVPEPRSSTDSTAACDASIEANA